MSGKAFFMLRGVDSALWTAARQQAQAEGVKITDLVEGLLVDYLSDDYEAAAAETMKRQRIAAANYRGMVALAREEIQRALADKG